MKNFKHLFYIIGNIREPGVEYGNFFLKFQILVIRKSPSPPKKIKINFHFANGLNYFHPKGNKTLRRR